MKQTISKPAFMDAFRKADRFDQFGGDALALLFAHFEEVEADTGVEIELDAVGICCNYAVATWQQIADAYDVDVKDMDDDEALETVMEYLKDNTTVVGTCPDGQIVYEQF